MERFLAALCCVLMCWVVVVRSGSPCTIIPSGPNTVVQLDSRQIPELDQMWNVAASEDGNTWSLSNTTRCYQEWQYCGGNSSSTLTTDAISDLNGAQLTIEVYFSFNDSSNTCSEIEVLVSLLGVVNESLGTITCRETSPRTFTYDATQAFELVFNASFPEGDCVTVTRVRVYATFEPCDMETIDYATYPMANHLVMASGMCVANSVQRDGSSLMRTCMNGTFADIPGSAGGCECLAGYQPDSMMTECIACPVGTYKPFNGSTSCLPCPANSNTTSMASTVCQCDPGYQRTDPGDIIGSACDVCVAGYYRASGGTCQPCPANSNRASDQNETFCTCGDNRVTASGNSTTTGEDCNGCAETRFVDGGGMCTPCPLNTMPTNPTDTQCMCINGRVTSANSMMTTSMECDACATNYYLTSGTCQPCPTNSSRPFSMDQVEQMSCMCDDNRATGSGEQTTTVDECSACIANYTLKGSECVSCPDNSMRPIGGSECTCLAGYNLEGDMCIAITTPPPTTPPPTTSTPITTPTTQPSTTSPFPVGVVAGVAGGVAVAVLVVLLLLICVVICRLRANRRGFYPTYEDKASEPPTMLRYSASLRSISSQTVVPADGRVTAKENEFYV